MFEPPPPPPPPPLPPAPAFKTYHCERTPTPIVIDGDLSKTEWDAFGWTDDFVDIEGDLKPKPAFRTRVKMCWDDTYFYIAAEMEEPHVWATLTQRDSVIFHDNDFEVFLNPSCDTRNYYELEVNALNTVWDLLLRKPYRQGGKGENEYDIVGLKTAVKVHGTLNDASDKDRGWDVEIAMPWAAFNVHEPALKPGETRQAPKPGEQWKVNFSRVEWDVEVKDGKYVKIPGRPEHNWVWSPMGLIDMHLPERWGVVEFRDSGAKPEESQKPAAK